MMQVVAFEYSVSPPRQRGFTVTSQSMDVVGGASALTRQFVSLFSCVCPDFAKRCNVALIMIHTLGHGTAHATKDLIAF